MINKDVVSKTERAKRDSPTFRKAAMILDSGLVDLMARQNKLKESHLENLDCRLDESQMEK